MAGSVWDRGDRGVGVGCRRPGVAHLGAAGSLLVALLAASCSDDAKTGATPTTGVVGGSGGTSSDSGGSSGGSSDSGGSGGTSSDGGGAGAPLSSGGSAGAPNGAAGSAGSEEPGDTFSSCRPSTKGPSDTCEYPESLGGAGVPTECGVTPGAWYPLGDSELTTWPERAVWGSASGVGVDAVVAAYDPSPLAPRVAFDSDGQPVVGWANSGLEVRRWNGNSWDDLAADAVSRLGARGFDMALDDNGDPFVFEQYEDSMRVLFWNDGDWVSIAEWPAVSGLGRIRLDAEGRPVVAYTDDDRLFVQRWNGSSFETLPSVGPTGSLSQRAHTPVMTFRQNGNVVVAWHEDLGDEVTLWLEEWRGENWEPLGDSATASGVLPSAVNGTLIPAVAVDSNDHVIVAWGGPVEGSFRVWDGSAWSPAEPGLGLPQLGESPNRSVYLLGRIGQDNAFWKWENGSWQTLTAPELQRQSLETYRPDTALAVGPDEQVAATWHDLIGTIPEDRIALLINSDGEWRELGEATAQGDGLGASEGQLVSGNGGFFLQRWCSVDHWDGEAWQTFSLLDWVDSPGVCGSVHLTTAPTGQVVVAVWVHEDGPVTDDDVGNLILVPHTLHLLGWTGAGWEPLTEPFDTARTSSDSSVAFDSTGVPFVGWVDEFDGGGGPASVVFWDGNEWHATIERHSMSADGLRLAPLADDQMLLLSYSYYDGEHTALYDAGAWHELPDLPRSEHTPISVAHDTSGTPFLAWPTPTTLKLYELTAAGWRAVAADEARLATLPEYMRIHAASEDGEVYVRRFEACSWHGISASDRAGGISNSPARSDEPSWAELEGTLCVSWMEVAQDDPVTLVRCHD